LAHVVEGRQQRRQEPPRCVAIGLEKLDGQNRTERTHQLDQRGKLAGQNRHA